MLSLRHFLLILTLPGATALACPPLPRESAAVLPLALVLARVPTCHPDVRAAETAAGIASADVRTAGQGPNPQLTLGAASLSGNGVGSGSLWNKTFDHQLRIDQLVERGDKPALRRAGAQALERASRADLAEARRLARVAATRAYFDLAAALARQKEMTVSIALNEESERALERRARAGDAAPLDATRFNLDATRVQADLKQTMADIRGLRLQLAGMIGAEDQADTLAPAPIFADVAALTADLSQAVDQRADVVAAQARVAAAEQARALALSQRTRDIGVGVQLSRYPASPTNTAGTGNTVSVSISVPLFVRHAYDGEIARAEADLRAAEELLRRVRLAAQTDLARARSDWEAADARYRIIVEQLVPAAERVAAGAELAYRRGASGVLDVLDARRSLRAAQVERVNVQAERAKAAAQLEAASQPLDSSVSP
jgi:outer membrane protein, heavy metal efflux system